MRRNVINFTKEGGEDPPDSFGLDQVHIDVADNGWIVSFLEEGECYKQEVYPYKQGVTMMAKICDELGIIDERRKPTK